MTSLPFVFPTEQRVLTPQEYAALGYIPIRELDVDLKLKPDKPLSEGFNFPAYRAETKEEYAVDLAIGIVKVGYTISTGGALPAAKTALGYTWSLVS